MRCLGIGRAGTGTTTLMVINGAWATTIHPISSTGGQRTCPLADGDDKESGPHREHVFGAGLLSTMWRFMRGCHLIALSLQEQSLLQVGYLRKLRIIPSTDFSVG